MRVCRVSQTFPTEENNGKGLHCFYTSEIMGYPTLVLTKFYPEAYWTTSDNVTVKKIRYYSYPFPKSIKQFFYFSLALVTFFTGQVVFLLKSIPSILKFQPQVTHLQSPHAILIGLFNKIFFKSSIVVTFHGSDFRRIKNNFVFMGLLRFSDKIFYVDKNMYDCLNRHFNSSKLQHTPSGIDLSAFPNMNLDRESYFITIGNLRWQKNHELLIRSFARVVQEHPNFALKIIGEGELLGSLKELCTVLGISDKVFFLGRKSTQKICLELSKSYAFVLSSETEGMPKVILEALSTGTPVISTDVGSCREVVGECGLIVKNKDEEDLADSLRKVIKNKDLYQSLISKCSARKMEYSWEKLANTLSKEFEKLTSR